MPLKADDLTEKQEAFCRTYIENGGNASAAYRAVYNTNPHCKPNTVEKRACELLRNRKVAGRIRELQALHVKKHEITVEVITKMMIEDRQQAKDLGQASAAIAANMGLAKIHGLVIEKREDVTHPRTAAQIDARIRQLLALRGEAGADGVAGSKAPDRERDEIIPTVPGHGAA